MPRSKDPRNYGPFYEQLADIMDRGNPDIRLNMSGNLAIYHRHNFYAYINAWKHEAQLIPKRKHLTPEQMQRQLEHAIRMEDVLRKYLVVISPDPQQQDISQLEVELRFVHRGMDDRQASVLQQLTAIRESMPPSPNFEELQETLEGRMNFTPVDGKAVVDEWEEMAGAQDVTLEDMDTSDVTDEDIAALTADPPVKDDLSDLITEGNQPGSPTQEEYAKLMTGHLTGDKESENSS